MASVSTHKNAPDRASSAEGTAPTPRVRLRLSTAEDVQREFSRLYKQAKSQQIEPSAASKLAYILNLLRQAIETGTLEARIQALEASQSIGRGKQ